MNDTIHEPHDLILVNDADHALLASRIRTSLIVLMTRSRSLHSMTLSPYSVSLCTCTWISLAFRLRAIHEYSELIFIFGGFVRGRSIGGGRWRPLAASGDHIAVDRVYSNFPYEEKYSL